MQRPPGILFCALLTLGGLATASHAAPPAATSRATFNSLSELWKSHARKRRYPQVPPLRLSQPALQPLQTPAKTRGAERPLAVDLDAAGIDVPRRWDAPELTGRARPGLLSMLRGITGGRRVQVDHGRARLIDPGIPGTRAIVERNGVYFRGP